jgi:rhamnosyltransferase
MPVKSPSPTRESICAVVVTYHPDASFEERLVRIEPQVGRVVIVDNASGEDARARLRALVTPGRIELIELSENLGIATALNRGLERALDAGFAWGLTFDQDSLAAEDLVERLIAVFEDYPRRDEIAVLGANYEEETTGTTGTPKRVATNESWIEVGEVITSGCLQSLRVFCEVGGYREDLFIYFVDNEYCRRVRFAGYRVVLARTPLIQHRTGSTAKHRLFHREYVTAHYAPWRHYYIVRNGLLVARQHWRADPGWAAHWVRSVARRSAISLLFEDDKLDKLRFMLRGASDAIRNRSGKLEGGGAP